MRHHDHGQSVVDVTSVADDGNVNVTSSAAVRCPVVSVTSSIIILIICVVTCILDAFGGMHHSRHIEEN